MRQDNFVLVLNLMHFITFLNGRSICQKLAIPLICLPSVNRKIKMFYNDSVSNLLDNDSLSFFGSFKLTIFSELYFITVVNP